MRILETAIVAIFLWTTCASHICLGVPANIINEKDKEPVPTPIILTSSPMIAVLASIVSGDDFIIDTINIGDSCPHHYSGKPSDRKKLEKADAVIYIDDNFEGFFASMIRNYAGHKYRISSNIDVVKFDSNDGSTYMNWHFWNNPRKTYMALEGIGQLMIQIKPEIKSRVLERIEIAKGKLLQLADEVRERLEKLGPIMLLSRSIEPLFEGAEYEAMFLEGYPGLKFVKEFELAVKKQPGLCVISDVHQKQGNITSKYDVKHVSVNSENLDFVPGRDQIQLYIDYISNMLRSLNSHYKC